MQASRRNVLTLGLGSLMTSCSPKKEQPAETAAAPKRTLQDFQPKSMLVVPEHPIPKAKFPVIDAHTHVNWVFGRETVVDPNAVPPEAAKQLADIVRLMDNLNIRLMVNLTGGNSGCALKNNIGALDRKYPGRFLNCIEPAWDRGREPGYPQWQADELAKAKDAGAVGLKILKTLGLPVFIHTAEWPLAGIRDRAAGHHPEEGLLQQRRPPVGNEADLKPL